MGTNELSMRLWHERELLTALLFKLDVQRMLLASGQDRWIDIASREIDEVSARLRDTGVACVVEAVGVAHEWGAPEDATLRELIGYAPDDAWREVFTGHLDALTGLTAQIAQVRDANTAQLRAVLQRTEEALGDLQGATDARLDEAEVEAEVRA